MGLNHSVYARCVGGVAAQDWGHPMALNLMGGSDTEEDDEVGTLSSVHLANSMTWVNKVTVSLAYKYFLLADNFFSVVSSTSPQPC